MATTVTLKPNAIDLSGSTSGTTTLQATAVAGTTTITLPAATDTLVGKATTDTLTNKTLTTPVISTISNTGTLTLPTSTDTLVGRATTDTLTNKTLTTPVISSLSSASATALTLQSAGTTAITVDTSQKVGIGTTSPARTLHVKASAVTTLANTNGALFTDASNAGVLLGSDNVLGYVQGVTVAGTATVGLVLQPFGGDVLVGTTSILSAGKLSVSFDGSTRQGMTLRTSIGTTGSTYIQFENSAGATAGYIIHNGTTTVSYVTSSDYRLKEEITPMTGALAKVSRLKPVTYKWKVDGSDGEGFIAHELAEVCPIAVTREKDAVDAEGNPQYQGIDTSFLVATLTAAIQELKAINDTQAATINALTARIVALEAK
jgi:hypothetical protein